jgi:hypothetical protein
MNVIAAIGIIVAALAAEMVYLLHRGDWPWE